MSIQRRARSLIGVFAALLIAISATLVHAQQAPINETVSVNAVPKTDAKSIHPATVEGSFSSAPKPVMDDEVNVDNAGSTYKGAGPCDPLDDQVMFSSMGASGSVSVRVRVIHRTAVGDVYWVDISPGGGGGGGTGSPADLWADVKDYGNSAEVFVVQDDISKRAAESGIDNQDDPPTLYCNTDDNGKGKLDISVQSVPQTADEYHWSLYSDGSVIASGPLTNGGGFKDTDKDIPPGSYTITLSKTGDDNFSRKVNVYIVQLVSVTVVSGASQSGTSGTSNFAAIKGSGDVIVQAKLNPDEDKAAAVLGWTGGDPIPNQPRQRKVSRSTPIHVNITAVLGTTSQGLDVWIIWANITVSIANNNPQTFVNVGTALDGTEILGGRTFLAGNGQTFGIGKVCVVGNLQPTGVGKIATAGWTLYQYRDANVLVDGAPKSPAAFWDAKWVPDGNNGAFLAGWYYYNPINTGGQIYALDAPNCGPYHGSGAKNTVNATENFYDIVQWNGETCSDPNDPDCMWHYQAVWTKGANPIINPNNVGKGPCTLNSAP